MSLAMCSAPASDTKMRLDPRIEEDAVAAAAGDRDALGRLYHALSDPLYRLLVSRTRDECLAQDIASATWERVTTRIRDYVPRGTGFASWLFTIARNILTDHHRSAYSRRVAPTEDSVFHGVTDKSPTPESESLARDTQKAVLDAVNRLPMAQRTTVMMHHWGGLSLTETAAAMGRTVDSVKSLHRRALRSLGPLLTQYAAAA